MNVRRALRLVKKELLQIRRDKRTLRMIFLSSVLQLFIFGYGVSTDITNISLAVLDEDRTSQSRALAERFEGSAYFTYRHYLTHPDEIDHFMQTGDVQVVLRIPRGFAGDLASGRQAQVQTILDGSDSMSAQMISGYVDQIIRGHAMGIAYTRLERVKMTAPSTPRVEGRARVWYNPELKSVNFMVPAVLSMILLMVTTMLTAMAIVKEKEIGTMEQLIVTPIRPAELIMGKTIPFLLIGLLDFLLVFFVARAWFGVVFASSLPLLLLLTIPFLLTTLGLGILISTISHTQQEATMTTFFFMFPSILLSGFMFPIENMPQVLQWSTYAIPMRYFLVIIRGIFLKGIGLVELWPQVLAVTVLGIIILGLAVLRFRKNLE